MLEPAELPLGSDGYRALGLMANPFRSMSWHPAKDSRVEIITHTSAVAAAAAFDRSLASGASEPVWVSTDPNMVAMYRRLAVSETLYALTNDDAFDVLVANVPFPMLSVGRIRSALNLIAERMAGGSFGRTLGAYVAHAFNDFDGSLAEAAGLTADEVDDLRAKFDADSEAAAAAIFGACVAERDEEPDVAAMMLETGKRQGKLELDPDESDEGAETDLMTELEAGPGVLPEPQAVDESLALPQRVRDYVYAHIRAHVSPVLARGLRAYVAVGTDRLAQELKITKAPRKTLRAICEFGSFRYRGFVILYDDFDSWYALAGDIRARVNASMTELRWLLKPLGVLAFVAGEGEAPELEEQFAGARRLEWKMLPLLEALRAEPLDESVVRGLIERCAAGGGPNPAFVDGILALVGGSDGEPERFAEAAGAAIDEQAKAALARSVEGGETAE
jgi:hypothetical protein